MELKERMSVKELLRIIVTKVRQDAFELTNALIVIIGI